MLRFERQCWSSGHSEVAGIDEAGRGPLAGPVVASAVIIQRSFAESQEHDILAGLTDSKKLSPSKREAFCEIFHNSPYMKIGIGFADVKEIDSINILSATYLAMARALENLIFLPSHALVDGLPVKGLPCPSTAIVKGDSKSFSIAAASVVAKVTRDAHMRELDALYPEYGFAKHKGYGSKYHIQALFEHGPCPVHRRSFRPVREAAGMKERK